MNFKFLVIVLVFVVSPLNSYAALTTDLVAHWNLDETSGARADSTANNNDLTDNNTVLYGAGVIGNAADFELTNSESLSITDVAQTGLDLTGNYSMCAWVKPESQSSYHEIFTKRDTGGGYKGYTLRTVLTTNVLGMVHFDNSASYSAEGSSAVPIAQWTYVCGVYNGSTVKVYFNGVENGTANVSTNPTNGNGNFEIGAYVGAPRYFDGWIDEAAVWSRAINTDEITALYNDGAGLAYPFSTSTSETASTTTSTATSTEVQIVADVAFNSLILFFISLTTSLWIFKSFMA